MVTIGIDRSLGNSATYKHICMENIKKLYTSAGRFDDKQQYKTIIEAAMLSTTEGFTDNNPMSPGHYVTVINPSARKSLCLVTEVLDVKKKTTVFWIDVAK